MANDEAGAEPVRQAARPRWRQWGWVQILVVGGLVLLALVYARSPDDSAAGGAPPFAAGQTETPPPLVRVVKPEAASAVLRIDATGTVQVRNYVALTPQVGGRVVSLSPGLKAGGAFAAGEELLVIDRQDFQLAYEQAQADVATAAADLQLRQAESEAAIANYGLLNPGAEVPPLVAKAPQIAQARARQAAAQARANIAALDLQRTRFSLPFAGRVQASSAEVGQVLARGQSFGQVFALDAVEVVVPVPPDDLARLAGAVGRAATVQSGEQALAAAVARVSPALDQRSRFATLYLTFEDAESTLAPGTFVDVEVAGPALANTFLLPAAAEQVGGSVWVVAGGALRQAVPETLGRTPAGWLVAAFDAADGVVIGAVPGARPALPVQTAAAAEPSA